MSFKVFTYILINALIKRKRDVIQLQSQNQVSTYYPIALIFLMNC